MKSITLDAKKQKILFGVLAIFIIMSFINTNTTVSVIEPQNFLNDILTDFGVTQLVSQATAYLVLFMIVLVIILYFFERKK